MGAEEVVVSIIRRLRGIECCWEGFKEVVTVREVGEDNGGIKSRLGVCKYVNDEG